MIRLNINSYVKKKEKIPLLLNVAVDVFTEKTKERIGSCGNYLEFAISKDKNDKRISNANYCNNRFCPICAWRRSFKDYIELTNCIERLEIDSNQEFYLLTLTVPNIDKNSLEGEIKALNNAFNKLMKFKKVNKLVKGAVRKLEVTYNQIYNTYNPHYHVILSVNKNSIKNNSLWIRKEEWLKLWRAATKNNAVTHVDLRKVKNTEKDRYNKISNYITKNEIELDDKEAFEVIYKNTKGKHAITYLKLFKSAKKYYKEHKKNYLEDLEIGKKIIYVWNNNKNNYKRVEETDWPLLPFFYSIKVEFYILG